MDELVFPGLALAAGLWFYWYYSFLRILSFRCNKTLSLFVGLTPPVCMIVLLLVLSLWSSPDVRSDGETIFFYMIFGALWLRLGFALLSLAGISVREDVLERQNRAAAWTVCGAMTGATFCFAGANIGRGPGPEAVLFSAVLSSAAFFGLCFAIERILALGDRLTVERDEGTGIRMGGWCAGMGLILGSAVAGEWKSAEATLRDFVRFGWGTIPFTLVGILTERYFDPQKGTRTSTFRISLEVAGVYLLAAGAYALWLNTH